MREKPSFVVLIAEYFKAHPNVWIDGRELARIGGTYAWRTRVSQCRRDLRMNIENRQRTVTREDGSRYTISEYSWTPSRVRESSEAPAQHRAGAGASMKAFAEASGKTFADTPPVRFASAPHSPIDGRPHDLNVPRRLGCLPLFAAMGER